MRSNNSYKTILKKVTKLKLLLAILLVTLISITGYLIARSAFSSPEYEYFNEKISDGMTVKIIGKKREIPADIKLSVKKVDDDTKDSVDESIDEIKKSNVNVVDSYTYDVKLVDSDGEEVELDEEIKIVFENDKISNSNLDVSVYHTTEDDLETEKLKGKIQGDSIIANTDSFSYYTVEFTYNNIMYAIPGDSEVALSTILGQINLIGEVSYVEGSNDELFSFEERDDEWYVKANKAFDTREWMKVTIDGIVYEITVTDANYTITFNPNGGTWNGTTGTSTKTVSTNTTNNNSLGSVPTRSGYNFSGWYLSSGANTTNGTMVYNSSGNAVAGSGITAPSTGTGSLPYYNAVESGARTYYTLYYGLGYTNNKYYYADRFHSSYDGHSSSLEDYYGYRLYEWNGASWVQVYYSAGTGSDGGDGVVPPSSNQYYSAWNTAWGHRNDADHGASTWPPGTVYWSATSGCNAPSTSTSSLPYANTSGTWDVETQSYGLGYYNSKYYYADFVEHTYWGEHDLNDYDEYRLYEYNCSSWVSVYSSRSTVPPSSNPYYAAWNDAWGHRNLSDHGASYWPSSSSQIVWVGTSNITVYARWSKTMTGTSMTSSISPTSYTYDGDAHCPTPVAQDGSTTLTLGTHYNIGCSNNRNAGTATATLIGAEAYNSTTNAFYNGSRSINFTIYPANPTISLTDHDTFSYSAGGATAYYVSTSSTKPSAGTASSSFALNTWTTATSTGNLSLSGGQTYYVWAEGPSSSSGAVSASYASIAVRTVSRSQGAGTTLTTKYDSSNGTSFTSTGYVLNGSTVYVSGSLNTGYSNLVLKRDNSTISASNQTIGANVTFSTTATLAPVLTFNPNGGSVSPTSMSVTYPSLPTNLPTATKTGNDFRGWYANIAGSPSGVINLGRSYNYTNVISIHVSAYLSDWSILNNTSSSIALISCTESGGFEIDFEGGTAKHMDYYLMIGSSYVHFSSGQNWGVRNISSGWHTWDLVYNGSTVYGYFDGSLFNSQAASGSISYHSTANLYVGAEATASSFDGNSTFPGYIGNVVVKNQGTRIEDSSVYNTWSAPAQNATLYAHYEPTPKPTPTISFSTSCGSVSPTSMGTINGTNVSNLPTPTGCAGYTFKGWYATFDGSSSYINLGRDYMYTDKISIHLSAYSTNWASFNGSTQRLISCTEGGGFNIEAGGTNNAYIQFAGYDSGVGYKVATSSTTWASLSAGWHEFDYVFDGTYLYAYVDGTLIATSEAYTSHAMGYNSTNAIFVGAEAGSSDSTPAGQYFNGYIGNIIIKNQNTMIPSSSPYNPSNTYNSLSPPVANLTLNARWDVNSYNLRIDPNGGTWNGSTDSTSYTQNYNTTKAIATPTRIGYKFVGWAESGGGSLGKLTNADPSFDSSAGGNGVYNNSSNGMVTHTMNNVSPNLLTNYDTSFLSYANGATTLFTNQMNSGTEEIVSNIGGASKALHLNSAGGNGRVYRTLALTAGHTYTWSADFYSINVTAGFGAMHTEMYGGDYNWNGNWASYNTPGKWQRISITWTPTSDTTLYYFFHAPTGGDTYIKDIKIEESSSPTLYTSGYDVSKYGNREIVIDTLNGTTSPGLGGFVQNTQSAANKKYIHTFVAKIPVGYSVEHAQNATGDGRVITWLTDTAGTGKYEVYSYEHDCGSSGSFSTFGHVYIVSGTKPMNWNLAYSHMFDITSGTDDTYTYGAGNGKLTALWVPNTYSIVFNANGGTGTMSNMTIREDESKTLTANVFEKRGYTFTGWNTKTDGTGISYTDTEVVKNITGEVLTKSQQVGNGWSSNMQYPGSGAPATPPSPYTSYGANLSRDATIDVPGYAAGKTYKISGYGVADSTAQSPGHVGFERVTDGGYNWSGATYLPASTRSWTYNEYSLQVPSNTTHFKGWVQTNGWPENNANYNGSNGVGGWYWTGLSIRDMGATSTTLYAQYTPITYTVNYSCGTGSGTPVSSQTVNYDATFTTATSAGSCSKTGYTFAGYNDPTGVSWSNWSGTWTYINGQYGISNNTLLLSAQWTPNKYNITYDYQTTPATTFVDASTYEDTGYLVNWDEDFTITGAFTPATAGNRYLVIGSFDDSTKTLNIEVDANNKMRVYLGTGTIDARSGTAIGQFNTEISYTFTWTASTKAYTLTATGTSTNISMSGTYSAATGIGSKTLWVGRYDHRGEVYGEVSPFTATVSARNLKITRKYTYDTTLTSLPTPATRIGYAFGGWWTTASGGSQVFSSTPVPAGNTTYYAHWSRTKLRVTETVKGNGADSSKEFSFTINVKNDGTGISGTYAYTGSKSGNLTFSSGNATFTLHHGQYIDVYFPTGYTYTITQANGSYTLTKTNDTGTFGNDVTAAFTDTLTNTTPTGVTLGIFPYIILLLVSIVSTFLIGKFKDI